MKKYSLKGQEFIQLNQLMKIMSWVGSGGEANMLIDDGLVKVNDKVELRRRNKLYKGSTVKFKDEVVTIVV